MSSQQVIVDCGRICNITKDRATVCNSYHRQMSVSNAMFDGEDLMNMFYENEAVVFVANQNANKQKKVISIGSKNELEVMEAKVESVDQSNGVVHLRSSTGELVKAIVNQTTRVGSMKKFNRIDVAIGTKMSVRVLPVRQTDQSLIAYSIKFKRVSGMDVAIDNEVIEISATHYTTQQENSVVMNQIGVIVGYADKERTTFRVNNGISGDAIITSCSISQYLSIGMFVRYDKVDGMCQNAHRVADIYPVQCSPDTVSIALSAVVLRCEHAVRRYWLWNDLIGRIHVPAALNARLKPLEVVTALVTYGRDRPDAQWTAIKLGGNVESEKMTRISCSSQLMTADFTVTFKKSNDRIGFIQNPYHGSGYVSVQDMNNWRQLPAEGTRVRCTFVKQYKPNTHECKPLLVTPMRSDNTLVYEHPVYEQGVLVSQPFGEPEEDVIMRTVITYQPSSSCTNSSPSISTNSTPSSTNTSPPMTPSPSPPNLPIIVQAIEYLHLESFEQLRQYLRSGDNLFQIFENNFSLYMDLYKVDSLSDCIVQH